MIISEKSVRQCSKHGSSCRFTDDGCVKEIDSQEMLSRIEKFIS